MRRIEGYTDEEVSYAHVREVNNNRGYELKQKVIQQR